MENNKKLKIVNLNWLFDSYFFYEKMDENSSEYKIIF